MLDIVCFKVGTKYGPEYPSRLARMVERHVTVDYEFTVYTDDPTDVDAHCEPLPDPTFLGWFSKLSIFRPRVRRVLCLDLDSILVSNIDQITAYDGPFAILRDFYRPAGWGSAIMSLCAGNYLEHVWREFSPDIIPQLPGGDQQYIEQKVPYANIWQHILPPDYVVSYKVHCKHGVPAGASVVCFHGLPRPLDVVNTEAWVKKEWS